MSIFLLQLKCILVVLPRAVGVRRSGVERSCYNIYLDVTLILGTHFYLRCLLIYELKSLIVFFFY